MLTDGELPPTDEGWIESEQVELMEGGDDELP
jgi:hypothetical protein